MSDFPGEQDSETLVRERARGTKLDGLYKKKKGVIVGETDHTIAISNKKRQPTLHSKRDVAITTEPQPSTSKQTTRKSHYEQRPESSSQPIKIDQPKKSTGQKKKPKLPKEFKRLANWEQLANQSTDEEEEKRMQQKAPIKATTTWEKAPKAEPKDSEEEETISQQSNQSNERPKRDRKTPNSFGNPVMICGIEQPPEVITISSSNED